MDNHDIDYDIDDETTVRLDSNDLWNSKYLELCDYRHKKGQKKVEFNTNKSLVAFLQNQKAAYNSFKTGKKGRKISKKQIHMLDGLGFHWGKKYDTPIPWDTAFRELKDFRNSFCHFNVYASIESIRPCQVCIYSESGI